MGHHASASSRTPRRGHVVLLRADTLWLLLPQHEVGAVEALDARPATALCGRMTVLPAIPRDRRLVTALAGSPRRWCWNEVKVLIDVALTLQPVPPVLHAPGMPMTAFVETEAGLAFVCSARALHAHVDRQEGAAR